MSKIKQARAWLARKERTDVEKRGDDNINKIVWIGVVIIVLGLVAGVLIFLVNTLGDDAAEEAANITTQDAAVYAADCEGVNIGRIGVLGSGFAGGDINVQIDFTPRTGYQMPANTNSTAPADGTIGGIIATRHDDIEDIAFLHTVSDVTETRFNADFNGDGRITEGQIVGLITDDGVNAVTAAATAGNVQLITNEDDGEPAVLVADGNADINARVGSHLVLDRRAGCWGVKV